MTKDSNIDSPLKSLISFNKIIEQYSLLAKSDNELIAKNAQYIIDAQAPYPELRDGFTDLSLLKKHEDIIQIILKDSFSDLLTHNEIKTASLPYDNIVFNSSKRFQKIIENAGSDFVPQMREMSEQEMYVVPCVVILNFYYGFNLDFKRPFFYDIPDANGVMKHYRILYNADFIKFFLPRMQKN